MATWSLGTALAIGWEPANGLPALGADVLPIELRVRQGAHSFAAQVDWSQLVASSALTPRSTVGLAGFWEKEPAGPSGFRAGPGLELGVGREVGAVDGHRASSLVGGVAPAFRAGWVFGGEAISVTPALRGALGVRSGAAGAEPWLRTLVEVSVVAGPR